MHYKCSYSQILLPLLSALIDFVASPDSYSMAHSSGVLCMYVCDPWTCDMSAIKWLFPPFCLN